MFYHVLFYCRWIMSSPHWHLWWNFLNVYANLFMLLVLANCSVSFFPDCDGSPLLPLLYICINMAFNISILSLVKITSAVVSSLVVTLAGQLFWLPICLYSMNWEERTLIFFYLLGMQYPFQYSFFLYRCPSSLKLVHWARFLSWEAAF